MANTFDWIEIRADNVETSSRFYHSLFGWRVVGKQIVAGSEARILDTGGLPRLENLRRAGIVAATPGYPRGIVVYVTVDDLDAMLANATRLGASVVTPRTELPGGYSASFCDPNGNILAMYQDKKSTAA